MNSDLKIKCVMVFGWLSGCIPVGYRILCSSISDSDSVGSNGNGCFDSNPNPNPSPAAKKQFNYGKILEVLNVLISGTLCLLYIFVNLSIICFNSMSIIAESNHLSAQIVVFTILFPKSFADAIIRGFCLIFYKRILNLAQRVLELNESLFDRRPASGAGFNSNSNSNTNTNSKSNGEQKLEESNRISNGPLSCLSETSSSNTSGQRPLEFDYCSLRKNKLLILMTLVTIVLCAAGDLMVSVDYNWGGTQYSKHLTMYFVPRSELGLRIYFQVLDNLPVLSFPFALTFVMVFGCHLTGLHGIALDKLSRLMLLRRKEEEFIKCLTFYHDEMGEAKKILAKDFIKLKLCFDEFGKMAGIFIIALMSTTVLSIIGSLSSVILFQKDTNLLDTLGDIAIVLLLARLGNFIRLTIDKHREDCGNETSFGQILMSKSTKQSSDPFLDWVLKWRWKLTACQVFKVGHDLVPAVAATLMTYFIFMFQLKTSESTK